MSRALISLNAGSSSLKFAVFATTDEGPERIAAGKLEGIGTAPRLVVRDANGSSMADRAWPQGAALTHEALLQDLFGWITAHLGGHEIVAVGHRVVHGGTRYAKPIVLDEDVMAALEGLCALAPLHQPHNLAAIRAVRAVAPRLPQVACFDTAFHRTLPAAATRFALPRAWHDEGVRRYGFHGLSYEYLARRLRELDPALAQGRVIAAHLGNGASLCAMRDGASVDTTMGFTALDGLVMGTRCGALDPGAVLHLIARRGMSAPQVEKLLYAGSGLLGVSGVSNDMRALHLSPDPRAREAIELFVWRAAREIGALAAALHGLDGVVFSAGIGENDPAIRAMICNRLTWLGVDIDNDANTQNAPLISHPNSRIIVRVIPTDEERMIALHVIEALGASNTSAERQTSENCA